MRINKTLLGIALECLGLILCNSLHAQYSYTTDNGQITITGYTGVGGGVTLPSTINGLTVTGIGDEAFRNSTGLTSVTIPAGITSIGEGAFGFCSSLTGIMVDGVNSAFSSSDGVLFDKSQTTLIAYPGSRAGSYTIPNNVTSIWGGAFAGSFGLSSVTIPTRATSIGIQAFRNCTNLTNVAIPASVASIGEGAFSRCSNLISVNISNGVSSIGDNAFEHCAGLMNVVIPASVTIIGEHQVFSDCTNLLAISVDAANTNYSSIDGVLYNKSQTTLIQYPGGKSGICTISASVTSIGDWAFEPCPRLTAISVDHLNLVYSSAAGVLFDKSQTTLIAYPGSRAGSYTIPATVSHINGTAFSGSTSLTELTIGNGIDNIGSSEFSGCTSLTSVTIGSGVTGVGDGAFENCVSLVGIYFQGDAPSLGLNVFDVDSHATVYYLPGTTGWGATFGGRPTKVWNLPSSLDIKVKTILVTLHVTPTIKYQLEASFDLKTWTKVGDVFTATTSEVAQEFNAVEVGRYFRISDVP